jgi:hypothetical protein
MRMRYERKGVIRRVKIKGEMGKRKNEKKTKRLGQSE